MKMLLIYSDTELETAEGARSLLDETGIAGELFPIKACPEAASERQYAAAWDSFGAFWNERLREKIPSHALILSRLPPRWIDSLAGFSLGAGIPFAAYGEKAISGISGDFSSGFASFDTENALREYLKAEAEMASRRETAQKSNGAREALLENGIPVNDESLVQCVANNAIEAVVLFFSAGFTPNTRDMAGVPLLNIAARNGHRDAVRLLLQSGARVDLLAEDRGSTALLDAVIKKYDAIEADLIEAGTDVNVRSKDGQSALIVAVGAHDEKAVEALLKAGADPDVPDSLGVSARKYATLFHKSGIISLFEAHAPGKEL